MDETIEVVLQKRKLDSKIGIQFVNQHDSVVVHAATSAAVQKVISPPIRIHKVNGIQAHSALQVATIIRDAQPGEIKLVIDNYPEVVTTKTSANGNQHNQLNAVPSRRGIMRSRTKKILSLKNSSSLKGFFSSGLKSVRHIVRGKKDKQNSGFLNKDGVVSSSDMHLEKHPGNQKSMAEDEAGNGTPSLSKQSSSMNQQSQKINGMAESHVSLDRLQREQATLPEVESVDADNDSSSILDRVSFEALPLSDTASQRRSLQCSDTGQSSESLGYGYEPMDLPNGNSRSPRDVSMRIPRSSSAHSFGYTPGGQRRNGSFRKRGGIQTLPGLATVEMKEFVKNQRMRDWVRQFRRSDPRYQIHHFFNDVAQVGTNNMEDFNPILAVSPLLRAFYKSSVFTVWRPTSFDAIRRMMLHEGVGKGLDIKGKSAKKGKLSGFVPFLQIHKEEHKREIRTHPKDARIRVFYNKKASRDIVVDKLREVCKEMMDTLEKAQKIVKSSEEEEIEIDDDTMEWALEKLIWTMTDPTVNCLDDYAPKQFGIDVPVRLFWEAIVLRQDISRTPGSENDVGRPSEPNFQNMNNLSLRKEPTNGGPKTVLMHYVDPIDDDENPLNPLDFVMAYEENNRVMPVVSDFDCFLVGTRGVEYQDPLPDNQLKVLQWCVNQIEAVLENGEQDKSWTGTWLNILKTEAAKGFHPEIPPLGFSDPKTYTIMKHAIHRLREEGSVRHGAECFNFYFPQELDDHFLVISDNLPGTTLPWKYVDPKGLQDILKSKIDEGYAFPLNPKWVLCDDGWKSVYDRLLKSQKANVQDAVSMWYPPASGIREKIESIHERYPSGFNPTHSKIVNADHDGTSAMDLAEQELRYYLTFQRAKRKLRGMLIWKRILDEHRQAAKAKREARESAALSAEGEAIDGSKLVSGMDETLQTLTMES